MMVEYMQREYDNPPLILVRGKAYCRIDKQDIILNGRIIKESNFYDENQEMRIVIVSDGVIHAGREPII